MYQIAILNKIDENTLKCFVPEGCPATPRKMFLLEEDEYNKYLDVTQIWREHRSELQRKQHVLTEALEFTEGLLAKVNRLQLKDSTSKEDIEQMQTLMKVLSPDKKPK
ncbi:hypothetical protein LCGC14_0377150 [marine sediment metagenome]|uniref:Uncharacterized protein n=1 Tax=marine sediment metagenome TaxID=412755 RepID=A0A0F9T9J0_9ZZZZ